MGILSKITGKKETITVIMEHRSGLPNFPKTAQVNMILDESEEAIIFKAFANKKLPSVTLKFEKIVSAVSMNEEEFEKQSKIGRAAVGGLLFGKTGAVVGAVTAGEKKKINILYIVSYTSEEGMKNIVLKDKGNINFLKFKKELEKHLPEKESKEIIDGNITL